MTIKVIEKIQTLIPGEDVGSLSVTWDMSIEYDIPSDRHPDNPSNMPEEIRQVDKIHSIEFQLFDCFGIDITERIKADKTLRRNMEKMLLAAIEYNSIEEIENAELINY